MTTHEESYIYTTEFVIFICIINKQHCSVSSIHISGKDRRSYFLSFFFKFREQDHNSPGAKLFSFSSCNTNYILYERRCKKEGEVETNEYNSYKTFKKESCVGSVNINKCRQTLVQMLLFVKR